MTSVLTRASSTDVSDGTPTRYAQVEAALGISEDVVLLELTRADGGEWPRWSPGAHIDLVLAPGLVRQYSLCGGPADRRRYRVAVLKEVGGRGGSAFVHEHLRAGDTVEVSAPRNHFDLEPAERYLFIAGGIGITPFLPMIDEVERSERTWSLAYGGRSVSTMAFADHLVAQYGDRVRTYPADLAVTIPLASLIATADPGTGIYACGPEGLLAAVETAVGRLDLAVHVERFRAAPAKQGETDRPLLVELARSGITIEVGADESVLDRNVKLESSCREGSCGSCEVRVLAGTPEHRDSVLTAEEQQVGDCMMVCVSRAKTDMLRLDL